MPAFVCRLVPPRPSFAFDMTPAEAEAMSAHMAYWRELSAGGQVLLYGPVADPAGPYGLAVLDAADEAEAERLTEADPAIRAGIGLRYERHPMLEAFVRDTHRGS